MKLPIIKLNTHKPFVYLAVSLLIFARISFAKAENSKLYVTLGYDVNEPKKVRASEIGLKHGMEWAVFSLTKKKYWGVGKVIKEYYEPPSNNCLRFCHTREYTELSINKVHSSNGESLLFVRPIPKNSDKVSVKEVTCSRLPLFVKREINKLSNNSEYQINSCYGLDLESNGSLDIIKVNIIGMGWGSNIIFLHSGSTWVKKYKSYYQWE